MKSRFASMLIPGLLGIMSVCDELYAQPAEGEVWTHVASACVVHDGSTAIAHTSTSRLLHAANQTGTIYARCNVTNPEDNGGDTEWDRLEVVYTDNDGCLSDNPGVTAILWRVNNINGGIREIATLESKDFCEVGPQRQRVSFSHTFNFTAYSYYVELQVRRNVAAGPNSVVNVAVVRLLEAP